MVAQHFVFVIMGGAFLVRVIEQSDVSCADKATLLATYSYVFSEMSALPTKCPVGEESTRVCTGCLTLGISAYLPVQRSIMLYAANGDKRRRPRHPLVRAITLLS